MKIIGSSNKWKLDSIKKLYNFLIIIIFNFKGQPKKKKLKPSEIPHPYLLKLFKVINFPKILGFWWCDDIYRLATTSWNKRKQRRKPRRMAKFWILWWFNYPTTQEKLPTIFWERTMRCWHLQTICPLPSKYS